MRRFLLGPAGALALLPSAPALADLRPLNVPASAGWQHARTGIVMRLRLGGLTREKIGDYGNEEADIALTYKQQDVDAVATIYLFHPGIDSVPLWFDRILAQIAVHKDKYGTAGAASPIAFAVRPGAPDAALRIVYPMQGGSLSSTGVAVVPVADWLLVVRLSSSKLDASALDAKLTAILNDMGWPDDKLTAPAAKPVADCAQMPSFRKGKLLPADMTQVLLNSMLSGAGPKDQKAVPEYCRAQQAPDGSWGVYRAQGANDGYLLALADAGRAIGVVPGIALKRDPGYSLTFFDLTRRMNYPNVSAMVPPEQALQFVNSAAPVSSVSTIGEEHNITISSDALGKK